MTCSGVSGLPDWHSMSQFGNIRYLPHPRSPRRLRAGSAGASKSPGRLSGEAAALVSHIGRVLRHLVKDVGSCPAFTSRPAPWPSVPPRLVVFPAAPHRRRGPGAGGGPPRRGAARQGSLRDGGRQGLAAARPPSAVARHPGHLGDGGLFVVHRFRVLRGRPGRDRPEKVRAVPRWREALDVPGAVQP
jgi:hypothetical protein